MLVCDLQGVLNENVTPLEFELTDPVIHYRSHNGRKKVFGRTDHGIKGMENFFETHICGQTCVLLGLRKYVTKRRVWSAM